MVIPFGPKRQASGDRCSDTKPRACLGADALGSFDARSNAAERRQFRESRVATHGQGDG